MSALDKSALWDWRREDFRGRVGRREAAAGKSGMLEVSAGPGRLELALEGKRLGSSIPPCSTSMPGKDGGASEILGLFRSTSDSSSPEPES